MLKRTFFAAALLLGACAASGERAPPPPVQTTAPAAQPEAPAPNVAAPGIAAPGVAAPAPAPEPRRNPNEIVVPGGVERQVTPPNGDPRTVSERMEDIRSWDRCVTDAQGAFGSDPMRPQLDSPEQQCARALGMANRTSVPISRMERRR